MRNSVLDAIKRGIWDFEPDEVRRTQYNSTGALPGSDEKLEILADGVREGLPLWHPSDCRSYDDLDDGAGETEVCNRQ